MNSHEQSSHNLIRVQNITENMRRLLFAYGRRRSAAQRVQLSKPAPEPEPAPNRACAGFEAFECTSPSVTCHPYCTEFSHRMNRYGIQFCVVSIWVWDQFRRHRNGHLSIARQGSCQRSVSLLTVQYRSNEYTKIQNMDMVSPVAIERNQCHIDR